MRFDVLTLFPEMVEPPLRCSILGRALNAGHFELGVHNIRAHGIGKHRTVDDTPYGGGSGMVMRVDVLAAAIQAVSRPDSRVILMDPGGVRFDQSHARRLAALPHVVLLCGHYEGVDERICETMVHERMSIGDFVLTGGELGAVVVVDAVARLLPGVLGNAASAQEESFSDGLLEYPQYTRPVEWQGLRVPELLLSGDHGKVADWRLRSSWARTQRLRPELIGDREPPWAEADRRKARREARRKAHLPRPPSLDTGDETG